jgi:hypothetical protein
MARVLIAYQEGLVSLDQLRCRMPELRRQDQAVQAELQSLETAAGDQTKYPRLVETLADFHARLRVRADTLDLPEQQKVLRLPVIQVLAGRETITIRHSIRIPISGPDPSGVPRPPQEPQQPPTPQLGPCYLLRSGRHHSALRDSLLPRRVQRQLPEPQNRIVIHPPRHFLQHDRMSDRVEKPSDVRIRHNAHLLPRDRDVQRVQRLVLAASWPERNSSTTFGHLPA